MSYGHCVIALGMLCMQLLSAEDLLSDFQARVKEDANQLIQFSKSKEDLTARSAVGVLIETLKGEPSKDTLQAVLAYSRKANRFEKTAAFIALSPARKAWCDALMKHKEGQLIAAASQAAQAIMTTLERRKLNAMPVPKPQPVDPDAPAKKKKKARKAKAPQSSIDTDLVSKLLASKSPVVQELGLTAAAYFPNPQFEALLGGIEDKKGAVSGLKLLFQVNSGKEIDKALVDLAFGKTSKQPSPIRGPNTDMMYQVLFVPAMAAACEALGLRGKDDYVDLIHEEALEHKDIRVQIEALRALGRIGSNKSIDLLIERIESKRTSWPVMIAVFEAAGQIPNAKLVQPLIDRLEKEKGRLRLHIVYALNSIRGEKSHLQKSKQWQEWWDKAQESFKPDMEKTQTFRASYRVIDMFVPVNGEFYGLPIFSDKLCFVVDTSLSMKGDKITNLREQTNFTIDGLSKVVQFNLVDFGGLIKIYYPGGLCNDKKGMKEYVEKMPMSYATRSLDAMEAGMEIDPVDTIYFLSDGAPVQTQIRKWGGIHASVNFTNRYRPIAMFTVSFSAGKSNAVQMKKLADLNEGKSSEIE